MSNTNAVSVSSLLEKMKHYDKDERYMATSDLCEYLKRKGVSGLVGGSSSTASPLDQNTEKRVCASVLKLLDDASHDVQTMAVKTLSVLLTTVHEDQVVEIADRLGVLILDPSKAELRDVYAIGLRTLVKTIPTPMGDHVSQKLIAKLLEGIRCDSKIDTSDKKALKNLEEIIISCLEILADLVERFGTLPHPLRQQDVMVQATLSQLGSQNMLIRKRVGNTLGSLSLHLDDTLLFQLVEILLAQMDASFVRAERSRSVSHDKTPAAQALTPPSYPRLDLSSLGSFMVADAKTLIRTISTLSGTVGHRLGQEQIDRIVPIFLKFCDPKDAIAGDDDCDHNDDISESALVLMNELREGCFAGLQSFILRCHHYIQPHLSQILQSSLAYMRYDPNYSYGDEDNDVEVDDTDMDPINQEDDDESDYEEEDGGDFEEDGDESYKLRRQAIQVLIAVSQSSRPEEISRLWKEDFNWRLTQKKCSVVTALVDRFKEREENCRVDIVQCFTNILSSTMAAQACGKITLILDESATSSDALDVITVDLPSKFISRVVLACDKKLLACKKNGIRTQTAALALLSSMCNVPGGMCGIKQLNSIFIHLKSILNNAMGPAGSHGSTKALKLDTLRLIRTIFVSTIQEAVVLKDIVCKSIMKDLCFLTQESWYKIAAESLRVLSEIPRILTKGNGTDAEKTYVAATLFTAIEPRLLEQDQDQEIKDCALGATSSLLSILHPYLDADKKPRLLILLLDKLRNETTRIIAIKTITTIASKRNIEDDGNLDMSPIFSETLTELAYLLRLSNRVAKLSALECLDVLILSPAALPLDLCTLIVKEIGSIIQGSDMHMSQLSIQVAMSLLKTYPSVAASSIVEFIVPALLTIVISPMMQEPTLESLLFFVRLLVSSETVSCKQLLQQFLAALTPMGNDNQRVSNTKVAVGNISKCVASIVLSGSLIDTREVMFDMLSVLESDREQIQPYQLQLYLKSIGDIGYSFDLSSIDGLSGRLEQLFFAALESSSEDEKQASAYGLGRVSAGAVSEFLPRLLMALKEGSHKKQFSILSTVREFVNSFQKIHHSRDQAAYIIDQLWPCISPLCTDKEEGMRTMVAECIGSMMILDPELAIPHVVSLCHAMVNDATPSIVRASVCWTVATSVKYAIAGRVNTESLSKHMPTFLSILNEEDLSVRNSALLIVYSAVHHEPKLIKAFMHEHILPHLYSTGQLTLKRTVDLGPFKHTVDDGLPLRKSAISIFHLCIEKNLDLIELPTFLPILVNALDDVEDIQLQAHQIVVLLCTRSPAVLLSSIDLIVGPLERLVNKKSAALKSGNEIDRGVELVKSALRAIVALNQVDGVNKSKKFFDFFQAIKSSGKLNLLEMKE